MLAGDLPAGLLTDNVDEVINNREIKVVAQLIGGLEPEHEERKLAHALLDLGAAGAAHHAVERHFGDRSAHRRLGPPAIGAAAREAEQRVARRLRRQPGRRLDDHQLLLEDRNAGQIGVIDDGTGSSRASALPS